MQNTGNPVLDSTINAFTTAVGWLPDKVVDPEELLIRIHVIVLKMAAKEPGGLKFPSMETVQVPER